MGKHKNKSKEADAQDGATEQEKAALNFTGLSLTEIVTKIAALYPYDYKNKWLDGLLIVDKVTNKRYIALVGDTKVCAYNIPETLYDIIYYIADNLYAPELQDASLAVYKFKLVPGKAQLAKDEPVSCGSVATTSFMGGT